CNRYWTWSRCSSAHCRATLSYSLRNVGSLRALRWCASRTCGTSLMPGLGGGRLDVRLRQIRVDLQIQLRWPLLNAAEQHVLDGVKADGPERESVSDGRMDLPKGK